LNNKQPLVAIFKMTALFVGSLPVVVFPLLKNPLNIVDEYGARSSDGSSLQVCGEHHHHP
jgi:hypothetical protein